MIIQKKMNEKMQSKRPSLPAGPPEEKVGQEKKKAIVY